MRKHGSTARPKSTGQSPNTRASQVMSKGLGGSTLLALLPDTLLSSAGSTPCVQLSSAAVPWPWHLQHLGASSATQASLSQLHKTALQGLHAVSLPQRWPYRLSFPWKKTMQPLCLCIPHDSETRTTWTTPTGSLSCLEWTNHTGSHSRQLPFAVAF